MLVDGKLIDPKNVKKDINEIQINDLVETEGDLKEEIKNRFNDEILNEFEFQRFVNGRIYYLYTHQDNEIEELEVYFNNFDFWYDPEQEIFISTNKKFIQALPEIIQNTIRS